MDEKSVNFLSLDVMCIFGLLATYLIACSTLLINFCIQHPNNVSKKLVFFLKIARPSTISRSSARIRQGNGNKRSSFAIGDNGSGNDDEDDKDRSSGDGGSLNAKAVAD
jgi:hypothetical protein